MSNQLISLADVLRLCDRYENESWYSPSEFVLDLRKLAQNNPSPQLSDMENQKGDDQQSPDRKLAYNPVDTYNSSPRENVKEQRDNNLNASGSFVIPEDTSLSKPSVHTLSEGEIKRGSNMPLRTQSTHDPKIATNNNDN